MAVFLAVDLGTTGCRSVLYNKQLEIISSEYEEYPLITQNEKFIEQDAELWWKLTIKTAKNAILKSSINPLSIKSISVSSQGITVIPVDSKFKPLCNAISWLDTRAEKEVNLINDIYKKDALFDLTGKSLTSCYTLPKLLWIKHNEDKIWNKAYKFLMPMDFIIAKFTGKAVTDHSMASGTVMYDIENGCWATELLNTFEIPIEKLPEIRCAGEKVGNVLKSVAKELGISEDCIVAVGGQDQKCAALGAGLSKESVTVSLGTAGAITKLCTDFKTHKSKKIGLCGYVNPSNWVSEGVINTAGTCLRYIRDLMFSGLDYSIIDKEAKQAVESQHSLLFFPYLSGPSAPNYYLDSQGTFYGINLATKRGEFAAAVMEGIAFQIRILLEEMSAYEKHNNLILFGGGAKGDLWCQIISDITNMKISVLSTAEAASAGAAILAAKACGIVLSPLKVNKEYFPSKNRDLVEMKYKKYREIEYRLWR